MSQTFKSKFRTTVPQSIFDAVAQECGQPFADSYLYGATLSGTELTPRTVTGYGLMKASFEFRTVIAALKLTLVKPEPFHLSGNHHTAEDCR